MTNPITNSEALARTLADQLHDSYEVKVHGSNRGVDEADLTLTDVNGDRVFTITVRAR